MSKRLVRGNREYTAQSSQELLEMMDVMMMEAANTNIRCNVYNTFSFNDHEQAKAFLNAWKEVFEMLGASMKWRRQFILFGDYVVNVKGADPVTVRHFVQAQFLLVKGDKDG